MIDHNKQVLEFTKLEKEMLSMLAKIEINNNLQGELLVKTFQGGSLSVLMSDIVNYEEELIKLAAEEKRLISEVSRSNKMLNNKGFMSKAPEKKIQNERDKLETYQVQLETVKSRIEITKQKMEK